MMANNKIYFGSPGTGKSFIVDEISQGYNKIVTTFYPDYDHSDFMGVYKPVISKTDKSITYDYVSGVFLEAYIQAWTLNSEPFYLVIEEINRGNCAQIFGDIFQLLDRDTLGFSRYFISVSDEIAECLEKNLGHTTYSIKIADLYLLILLWHSGKSFNISFSLLMPDFQSV